MRFDSEFIRELKARCRIEDVIGKTLQLKRAGSNYVACCPFHSEKTPSFTVFPNTQNYYCFGCSEGGDIITFVMKTANMEYPEAVKYLADFCGLPVPIEDDPRAIERQRLKKRLSELNLFAAKFFREQLFSDRGSIAREYLFEKRKLSVATVKRFGLGYAPDEWNAFSSAALNAGYTEQELYDAFFAGKSSKTGKPFDYFRNRVMFPYFDINGNVIAFGGRIIGDGEPKYLNTKDTPIFKKGLNLYAMNYAKNTADETLMLCEGYMDVISLHQAGFSGAVASCGTALTEEQARVIARYAKRVVICYDSDKAGTLATQRAVDILAKHDIVVAVLNHSGMKGAKDPDEFIKLHGSEAFRMLIDGSGSQNEYMLSKILGKYNIDNPEDKIRIVKECSDYIATLESRVAREVYSSKIADKVGISEKSMLDEVEHKAQKNARYQKRRYETEKVRDISRISDRINTQASRNLRAVTAEENLIGILAAFPEMIKKTEKNISPDDFVTSLDRDIYARLIEIVSDGGIPEISTLSEFFEPNVMSRIYELKESRIKLAVNDEKEIESLCSIIREEKSKCDKAENLSDTDFLAVIEKMKNKKQ